MAIELRSKLPHVGTTIFSVMSKLAQESGAINLSQGFPDFPIHEKLGDLVHAAIKAGHNQYAPMPGVPALREAIAAKVERLYGFSYDPDTEITVTAGATQALFTALGQSLQAFVLGYVLAVIVGIPLGLLIGRFRFLESAIGIYIIGGYAMLVATCAYFFVLAYLAFAAGTGIATMFAS